MGTSIGQADGMKVSGEYSKQHTQHDYALLVAGVAGISGAQYLIN
jgi:hypothetical protein